MVYNNPCWRHFRTRTQDFRSSRYMSPFETGERSAATTMSAEGVVVKPLTDIHEPIDRRLSHSSRPDEEELDLSLRRQLSGLFHPKDSEREQEKVTFDSSEPFYIDFEEGDERNPINFSLRKKWTITLMACMCTVFSSSVAPAYNMGIPSMTRDLNCTTFQANIGLSVYALGFGIVPLVTASFSEEFGRKPLYIGSCLGFFLMYIMVALSKNIQTVIVARFLQGVFGSTGATMVGGTIADIWGARDRGLPMSIFAVAAIGGTGLGPVVAGWVEMNPRLEWRWIQWIQMIIFGAFSTMIPVVMTETRTAILLTRIAKKVRKDTGDPRYRARIEDERASLKNLIFISCTRPILLMFTEPIVLSFSLWVGFAWGVLYCLITSISGVFRNLHGFNNGEIGTTFITMTIGSLIGFAANMYQEVLYQVNAESLSQSADPRLDSTWLASPQFSFQLVFIWAAFIIYLAVFSYLADCYGPFASSALAGQSLARKSSSLPSSLSSSQSQYDLFLGNLMATAFPLFTEQMFRTLDYKWANTLFGCIAVLMIPIPFA
ncbi:hypothetical protein D9615_002204 [Tricholomella constricta]|uniref:Major facilitator superfamily (MFS) profile domain-containing protein n=1 Tax=Tricholomella constricta TaxID=117010 RepID=A0A8H5HLP3_9AGAR|nr:hypothetical protein D9615_002204 [Tricholomella constricta]